MGRKVIEGKWEDVTRKVDLRGKHVKVVMEDGAAVEIRIDGQQNPVDSKAWLQRLQEWADGHAPVGHIVDDSRDGIDGAARV